MRTILRYLLTFQGMLWTLAVTVILFLFGVPLAHNLWAYYMWDRVACVLEPVRPYPSPYRNYYFERNGVHWFSSTRDFWDVLDPKAEFSRIITDLGPPNAVCYVNSDKPPRAVLYLDAHTRWDRALPRVGIAVLVAVSAALLSYAARRQRRLLATKSAAGKGSGGT